MGRLLALLDNVQMINTLAYFVAHSLRVEKNVLWQRHLAVFDWSSIDDILER